MGSKTPYWKKRVKAIDRLLKRAWKKFDRNENVNLYWMSYYEQLREEILIQNDPDEKHFVR